MTTAAVPSSRPDDVTSSAYSSALEYLKTRQLPGGAFAGEVVWNPMLVCQYVIVCHIVGHDIDPHRRSLIRRALETQQFPDGGWGMLPVIHPEGGPKFEGSSWLFHTTLGYVALRLLGYASSDPLCQDALKWIHANGGVYTIPTWGRIWLALLGLYPWSGTQPILPELWLLPDAAPMHPRRLYCHMRLIYLGLSYLYGAKFCAPQDATVAAIRKELFPDGYNIAQFTQSQDTIAATDLYEQPSRALQIAFSALRKAEHLVPNRLRRRALARAMEHILFEFRSTDYVCLSPVNGFLFCLALYTSDPRHPELRKAIAGMEYWVWEDERLGTRFCGARSDIWDTSFLLTALSEGPRLETSIEIARDACRWLPTAQIQQEITGGARHYRESAYGGWGFANEHHPWPVSDCTAEAVEALMRCEKMGLSDAAGQLHLGQQLAALEFILARQNEDGGFGSYEPRRGPLALKNYNPAEIYGNCMLEYSYTECTGSCVRALAFADRALGESIRSELRLRLRSAIDLGKRFLLEQQHESGAWMGFWGINGTYGTFFATAGLLAAGMSPSSPTFVRASRWLVEQQRDDGGWGESYRGMLEDAPIPLDPEAPSLVVQTAWAVLTLLDIAPHESDAIDRAVAYLRATQSSDGSWAPESPSGCFFNTAVLDYDLYRQIFPTWALARYLSHIA